MKLSFASPRGIRSRGAFVSVDSEVVPERGAVLSTAEVTGRVVSVDVLRGLTILLMVFVNDLGPGAPAWMHHIHPPDADGMTLADVVFPLFLFIVGVSIPLALERAREAGKPAWAELGHILFRTAGLLFLGLVEFNSDDDRRLGDPLWGLLAFTAAILAWCVVPRERSRKRSFLIAAKVVGILGLLALLALYRREPVATELALGRHVEGWVWLRTGWWGILGLIGWAYLTVSLLTLLLGRRREWLMGALAILMAVHLAFNHGGLFTRLENKAWLGAASPALAALARAIDGLGEFVGLGDATGSLAAIAMAGCLIGTILRRQSDVSAPRQRLSWALVFASGLFVAGLVTDTFEGINKIAATPTWCFWSAALGCVLWAFLYLVTDVAGLRAWSIVVRPAGANPLVAYFLHPIVVGLISVAGLENTLRAYTESVEPWRVVGGSLGMAFFICIAAGVVGRLGLRVRL